MNYMALGTMEGETNFLDNNPDDTRWRLEVFFVGGDVLVVMLWLCAVEK